MKRCATCTTDKQYVEFGKDRHTPDGYCYSCKECRRHKYYADHEKNLKYTKNYQRNNVEKIKAYRQRLDVKARVALKAKAYHKNHPDVNRKAFKKLKATRPGYHCAKASITYLKKCGILNRMPPWLTDLQKREIEELHALKLELRWLSEEELTVDHIVPLKGKNVSGLHVPWNLQILPRSENMKKSNKF